MTVKKAVELIELNNKHHLEDIALYNEILEKYNELNRIESPRSELQQIFLDLVNMIKKTKEIQLQFNNGIIKLLTQKRELAVQDKVSARRNQVRKLFLEGYEQKWLHKK